MRGVSGEPGDHLSTNTHKDTTRMTTDHEEVYEADERSTFNTLVSRETAEAGTRG